PRANRGRSITWLKGGVFVFFRRRPAASTWLERRHAAFCKFVRISQRPRTFVTQSLVWRVALDRGAMHVASQMWRTAMRQMDRAAVIPEHKIVRPPRVAIDEMRLRGMPKEKLDQSAAFGFSQVDNARRETLAYKKAFPPGLRVRA